MNKREILEQISKTKKEIKKYEKAACSDDISSDIKAENRRILAQARNRLCVLQYDLECAEESNG